MTTAATQAKLWYAMRISSMVLAVCVLLALGEPPAQAEQAVSAAGSHPETAAQRALVAWCAARSRAR